MVKGPGGKEYVLLPARINPTLKNVLMGFVVFNAVMNVLLLGSVWDVHNDQFDVAARVLSAVFGILAIIMVKVIDEFAVPQK